MIGGAIVAITTATLDVDGDVVAAGGARARRCTRTRSSRIGSGSGSDCRGLGSGGGRGLGRGCGGGGCWDVDEGAFEYVATPLDLLQLGANLLRAPVRHPPNPPGWGSSAAATTAAAALSSARELSAVQELAKLVHLNHRHVLQHLLDPPRRLFLQLHLKNRVRKLVRLTAAQGRTRGTRSFARLKSFFHVSLVHSLDLRGLSTWHSFIRST